MADSSHADAVVGYKQARINDQHSGSAILGNFRQFFFGYFFAQLLRLTTRQGDKRALGPPLSEQGSLEMGLRRRGVTTYIQKRTSISCSTVRLSIAGGKPVLPKMQRRSRVLRFPESQDRNPC